MWVCDIFGEHKCSHKTPLTHTKSWIKINSAVVAGWLKSLPQSCCEKVSGHLGGRTLANSNFSKVLKQSEWEQKQQKWNLWPAVIGKVAQPMGSLLLHQDDPVARAGPSLQTFITASSFHSGTLFSPLSFSSSCSLYSPSLTASSFSSSAAAFAF